MGGGTLSVNKTCSKNAPPFMGILHVKRVKEKMNKHPATGNDLLKQVGNHIYSNERISHHRYGSLTSLPTVLSAVLIAAVHTHQPYFKGHLAFCAGRTSAPTTAGIGNSLGVSEASHLRRLFMIILGHYSTYFALVSLIGSGYINGSLGKPSEPQILTMLWLRALQYR